MRKRWEDSGKMSPGNEILMDKKALTAVLALRRWSESRSVDGQKREKAKQTHQSARARTEGEHPSSPLRGILISPPQQTIIRLFRTPLGEVDFQPKPSRHKI